MKCWLHAPNCNNLVFLFTLIEDINIAISQRKLKITLRPTIDMTKLLNMAWRSWITTEVSAQTLSALGSAQRLYRQASERFQFSYILLERNSKQMVKFIWLPPVNDYNIQFTHIICLKALLPLIFKISHQKIIFFIEILTSQNIYILFILRNVYIFNSIN